MIAGPCVPEGGFAATTWEYELVPLLPLPQVDLSVSIKARLTRSRAIHNFVRRLGRSPLTFLGTLACEIAFIAVFFVRAPLGRVLGVVGAILGVPGAIVAIGNMRFELALVLLKTYDVAFFLVVATMTLGLVASMLQDSRGLLLLLSWLGFMTDIFVDASILGVRAIWIANIGGILCYFTIGAVLNMQMTDGLVVYNIVEANDRALPALSVVRDGLATFIVVMLRNMFRKFHMALYENQPSSAVSVTCVSYRCRLQLQRCSPVREQSCSLPHSAGPSPTFDAAIKSPLRYTRVIEVVDIRQTIVHHPWLFQVDPPSSVHRARRLFPLIGACSFMLSTSVGVACILSLLGSTRIQNQLVTSVAIACGTGTVLFISVCVSTMQRTLVWAVVTSFDFAFVAVQIIIVGVTLVDLLHWDPPLVLVVNSASLWGLWLLTWDAITPHVRRRLGLTSKFAAFIATALVVKMSVAAIVVVTVLPPSADHDRVLLRLNAFTHTMEFRALTWYCSCAAAVFAGTLRLVWRLWWASETELVLLDGPVAYDTQKGIRSAVRRDAAISPTPDGH